MDHFDVLVIGSGAGLKIAQAAAQRGLKVALAERGPLGGTCLNRGCIPSKMLIHPATLMTAIRHAGTLGVDVAAPPTVRFADVIRRIVDTVGAMSQDIAEAVARNPNIRLLRGEARFAGPRMVRVGADVVSADRIFLATGAVPTIPEIEGLAGTPFWTSTEAMRATRLPASLAVIGGGYIACELGCAYAAFGSDVTFLVRSELLRTADRDVRQVLQQAFAANHRIHDHTRVHQVRHDGEQFHLTCRRDSDGRVETVTAEALLVATGVHADTTVLDLPATGVETDDEGRVRTDDHLKTTADGVWALGDCVGRYMLRHSANREADYLVRHVFDGDAAPIWHGPIPYAVFTEPEVAGLGATEDEMVAQGSPYVAGVAQFGDSNVSLARGIEVGFCKLLVCRDCRKLLGAHIVGPEASDVVHVLIALMYREGLLDELLEMVYIHPALPEIVRDAARDAAAKLGS